MKKTLIVLGSWLIGGLLVVLMSRAGGIGSPSAREVVVVPNAAERTTTVAERTTIAAKRVTINERATHSVVNGIALPVSGVTHAELRDTYDQARGSRRHDAIDILAPMGTPVVAAVDGTVRKLFISKAGGLTIYQFDEAESYLYYYAHLDRYRDGIGEGDRVKRGEIIGYVGVTGNAGNTPHLHFSIERLPPTKEWWKGTAVNPYPVLMGRATL
ncbi:MAG: M23 family metallopeptidase [Thermoanaerobaculia bacterium]